MLKIKSSIVQSWVKLVIVILSLPLLPGQLDEIDPMEQHATYKPLVTIEEVWKHQPNRIRSLLHALQIEPSHPDWLNPNIDPGDTLAICRSVLEHLKSVDRSWVIRAIDPMPEEEIRSIAAAILSDSVEVNGVVDRVPRHEDGTWQWDHLGPHQDAEFAYSLNAQKYLPALYLEWRQSHDAKLVQHFNLIVQDWVTQHPLPNPTDSIFLVLKDGATLDYRDIGEVQWRTLDTGRRLGAAWPQLFFGFYDSPAFSDATKLLMLASMVEQAEYLHQYHKSGHNWTTMEMNGLALVALAFPEFKKANAWSTYALDIMTKEINRQVYPDGVQTEISTKTQWVALRRFESLAVNFSQAGQSIHPKYLSRIEEMYHYLAYCMRPDGHQPLNNDSDREDLRPRVLKAAGKYGRSDWQYIATNGTKGTRPVQGPSITFPWAGISIFRSGWDRDADWSFFDIGPYGTGHQHRDKLHFSLGAFGRDLLVDGGRFTHRNYFSFDPTNWRGYFRSSFSHNVLLIDGHGQNAGPTRAEHPVVADQHFMHRNQFDFASGTFRSGFEFIDDSIEHTRSLLYLKNNTWLAIDQLVLNQPHTVTALWHLAPDLIVKEKADQVIASTAGGISISIVPLGEMDWDLSVIKGQEKPVIQGWYSPDYDVKMANPTLQFKAEINQPVTFLWLMVAQDQPPEKITAHYEVDGNVLRVSYSLARTSHQIAVPIDLDPRRIKIE